MLSSIDISYKIEAQNNCFTTYFPWRIIVCIFLKYRQLNYLNELMCASFARRKIIWAIWTVRRSFHVLFEEVIKQKRTKYLVKEEKSVRALRNILSIWAICLFRLLLCPFIASLVMLLQASRGEKAIQTEKHLLTFNCLQQFILQNHT